MNISLIGMMGSGKTTIAKLMPDFRFVDTDSLIVERENRSINDIFSANGEEYFRQIESKILADVLQNDNQIISTGGGIVIKEENLYLLKENSFVVYLKASADCLFERVKNDTQRPLLNTGDMKAKIEQLLQLRESKYAQAHFTMDTENKTPDIIVQEILKEFKNYVSSQC